ncbi:hypothetical protein [Mucilaginibacter gracilis]|nr:hypothetical protein [Mucilaginibacter gracilis]
MFNLTKQYLQGNLVEKENTIDKIDHAFKFASERKVVRAGIKIS